MRENHFWLHISQCFIFYKITWAGHFHNLILDARKSLSIPYLAISDQYTTFCDFIFFHNVATGAILDAR